MLRTVFALLVIMVCGLLRLILPFRWIERAGWAMVLAAFRIRVEVHGRPVEGGAMLLANHVSWIDIVALGRMVTAGFIAKAEVARWPVIGAGARRIGCIFIDRSARIGALAIRGQIAARLAQGRRVVLFPEGTTGPGDRVLRFQSSLMGAQADGEAPPSLGRIAQKAAPFVVQPVGLVYRTARDRRLAAWLGDALLLPHAVRLAREGGVRLEIWFEEPFSATDRKAAARRAEAVIAARLAERIADQDATLKRAA